LATLCHRKARSAFGLAGYLLGDRAEAEDAVQDAVERVVRAWPQLKDEAKFDGWFDRILVNVCRDRARHRPQIRAYTEVDSPSEDPFRTILERDVLGRAIASLPIDQRVVVVLRFWRDMSLEQIADLLDLPIGTVKSRLHYSLESLRGKLTLDDLQEVWYGG
jgi:RNA polymerase sigma-70 factor (ECF subfamily)